ncbi:hypothetical protein [uncultured Sphingomonas sp.]|uniref:hypothetical protein n=1 Tax=uncultured Sphingomonas sp. TaxID=158754 RepID=UPI0035CC7DFB
MAKALRTVGKVAGIISTIAIAVGRPEIAAIAAAVATPAALAAPITGKPPMSAVNVFTDNRRAYLATDGAAFNCDTGAIAELGSKAVMMPSLHMAFAVTGRGYPGPIIAALDRHVSPVRELTQGAILQAMPAAVREVRYRLAVDWPDDEARGHNQVRVFIAAYDRIRARPRALSIISDPIGDEPPGDAYRLREIEGYVSPALDPATIKRLLPHGYITDPKADARRILEEQRRVPFAGLGGRCGVGGTCEFYTVSRKGVEAEQIVRFPEVVGEVPNPGTPGQLI